MNSACKPSAVKRYTLTTHSASSSWLSHSKQALTFYYCSYIRPVLEYASIAWPVLPAHLQDRLERFQRRVFKVVLSLPVFEHSDHDTLLLTVNQRSTKHLYNIIASIGRLSSDSFLLLRRCCPCACPSYSAVGSSKRVTISFSRYYLATKPFTGAINYLQSWRRHRSSSSS